MAKSFVTSEVLRCPVKQVAQKISYNSPLALALNQYRSQAACSHNLSSGLSRKTLQLSPLDAIRRQFCSPYGVQLAKCCCAQAQQQQQQQQGTLSPNQFNPPSYLHLRLAPLPAILSPFHRQHSHDRLRYDILEHKNRSRVKLARLSAYQIISPSGC